MTVLPYLALLGCGALDAGADPTIEAHRGASGHWPQNSALAMTESIAAGYDGLEFDLGMTSDEQAVLSHDPWVHREHCTWADGAEITEDLLLRDFTLAELQAEFLCGGPPDPEFPDAVALAEPMMSWEELLVALEQAEPDLLVHIDVKFERDGLTLPPETFAAVIMDAWDAADLPLDYYVSANTEEAIQAFEARDPETPTSLIWPRFPPGESATRVAMTAELMTGLGAWELVDIARDAEADGLAIPYQVIERRQVEVLKGQGLTVGVWTLNEEDLLRHYAKWPVDSLITDFPERAE
jgi:glycerophosphoryl diester phosphodiesterase